MGEGEFDIIEGIFAARQPRRADVRLGVGDDCAILAPPPDQRLAVSVDTLVEGVHFPSAMASGHVGHRSLAVSLSDLAAMGAEPAWATLALTLPQPEQAWLRGFHAGFATLASAHDVDLVGGDLTRGPLTITVQIHGFVPDSAALLRSGARPGDCVLVTGTLGDAAAGLGCAIGTVTAEGPDRAFLLERFERPQPRVAVGRALRGLARAAIDVSDGLLQDLGHVLRRSGVGAEINAEAVPRSPALRRVLREKESLQMALSGGDDYELCFTCPSEVLGDVKELSRVTGVEVSEIGRVVEGRNLRVLCDGQPMIAPQSGYDHFRAP